MAPEEQSAENGLFSFVSQLKAGRGLTIVAKCIEGDFVKHALAAEATKTVSDSKYVVYRSQDC